MSDHANAEDAVTARVMRRLLPFLLLMYMLAFLDRANIGFAQKALQHDTGLSNAAFAFGAGVFFVGYALFEVPSNLLLHRVGAKLWMCRIMVTWGLVSAAMAFAHTATAFYVLRFMLGVAEAGFFPGIVYYLTRWFPQSARARALGVFYFGAPLAFIFGSPLSGALLDLHGALGFAGWQWLFLVEGVLASIVGVWAFWYLDDDPSKARWLDGDSTQLADITTRSGRSNRIRAWAPFRACRAGRSARAGFVGGVFPDSDVCVWRDLLSAAASGCIDGCACRREGWLCDGNSMAVRGTRDVDRAALCGSPCATQAVGSFDAGRRGIRYCDLRTCGPTTGFVDCIVLRG